MRKHAIDVIANAHVRRLRDSLFWTNQTARAVNLAHRLGNESLSHRSPRNLRVHVALEFFGHLVEHVADLVHPATLLCRLGILG